MAHPHAPALQALALCLRCYLCAAALVSVLWGLQPSLQRPHRRAAGVHAAS